MNELSRMSWKKLMSTKRVLDLESSCDTNRPEKRDSQFIEAARTEFERDSDQIIYSSQFRRLQDKTQVIPFPEYDFVHTRLTHTLEVASVGRSLGHLAGNFIKQEEAKRGEILPDNFTTNVAEVVRAACLAHDIGNPSFGHSGEDAISCYFEKALAIDPRYPLSASTTQLRDPSKVRSFIPGELLDSAEARLKNDWEVANKFYNPQVKRQYDLLSFEGNANGFRILANCRNKALNPTCATLGAFSKYPRESIIHGDPRKEDRKILGKSQAKYGFFQSERDKFKEIAKELGLLPISGLRENDLAWKRHPLAFLMEAADDICYQMIDFEDGCRMRLINFREAYTMPGKTTDKDKKFSISPREILFNIASVDESFDHNYIHRLESNDVKTELSYLRSKAINVLTYLVHNVFKANYEEIMIGTFDKALIDCIDDEVVYQNLNAMEWLIRNHVYTYTPVLESEAAGFKVIAGLLHSFGETAQLCKTCEGERQVNAHEKKLLSLLPRKYHPTADESASGLNDEAIYKRYLNIIDYVSGMTDGFAIALYRKIEGIALP